MQTKKRSPIAAIVLAVVIGLLVIALLNGVIRPTQVVVAKVAIAPGTVLTDQLVELRTIPMGAKPADATSKIEDVTGKILAVGRAPGDLIVTSVLGEIASAGIPAELPEGHVALAIHVDLASGVAGLLRPGQTVTVIGMISPDILKASTTSVFTAPIAEFSSPIFFTYCFTHSWRERNTYPNSYPRSAGFSSRSVGNHRCASSVGASILSL